ncbi:hypothetical protein MRB53_025726 [Persea americana]|uniref:Uncharacterized protein n=1 Tax=Persea americana TaxID=3435 RepID=A0ACC2LGM5_PERAE|nr:hypothetical protein MRB53_025726 [Persea americana]
MALTAERSAELRQGSSPATAVVFPARKLQRSPLFCISVWMPAMISTPTKISKQRDREPQIFFVSGEGDCEAKQSGSFGTKNWVAINALRLSPSLGTVNPRKPDLLPLGTNSDTNGSSVSSNAEPCKQILFFDLFFLRFLWPT